MTASRSSSGRACAAPLARAAPASATLCLSAPALADAERLRCRICGNNASDPALRGQRPRCASSRSSRSSKGRDSCSAGTNRRDRAGRCGQMRTFIAKQCSDGQQMGHTTSSRCSMVERCVTALAQAQPPSTQAVQRPPGLGCSVALLLLPLSASRVQLHRACQPSETSCRARAASAAESSDGVAMACAPRTCQLWQCTCKPHWAMHHAQRQCSCCLLAVPAWQACWRWQELHPAGYNPWYSSAAHGTRPLPASAQQVCQHDAGSCCATAGQD